MMIDEKTVSIPIEDAIKEFREAEPDIGEAYIIACLELNRIGYKEWGYEYRVRYQGIYFKTKPGAKELRGCFEEIFDKKIKDNWQWPEYKSNNKYYTATRISAINTMICNCYIINTAEGTVYHPHESNPKTIKKIRGEKGWNIQYMSTCPDWPARNSGYGKTAFSASTLDGTATTESMLMCVPYGTMHIWYKGDAENKTRINLPSVGRKELSVCPQCGRYDLYMSSYYSYARNSIRGFYIRCGCGLHLHTDAYDLGCRADDKEAEYAVVAERTIRIWNNIRVDPDDYRKQYSDDLTMIGEVIELVDNIAIVKMPIPKPETIKEMAQVMVLCPIRDIKKDIKEGSRVTLKLENITAKRLIRQRITGSIVDVIDTAPEPENT